MAQRQIIWTRTADIQLIGVLEYWANRNKSKLFAEALLKIVTKKTLQIADNPKLFRATHMEAVRMAPLGHYSIFYKITEKAIFIIAFWDNRQDPKRLLEIIRSKK
jgi:plasmid stabilization system protein ParE